MIGKAATRAALIVLILTVLSGCGQNSGNGGTGDTVQDMTLEKKVGQLFLVGFEGTAVTPELEQWFRSIHPGGVILFGRNISDALDTAPYL